MSASLQGILKIADAPLRCKAHTNDIFTLKDAGELPVELKKKSIIST